MWDIICGIWTKIRQVCCFTAIFSTVGIGMFWLAPHTTEMMTLAGVFFFIGFLSSIIVCPLDFLSMIGAFTGAGFTCGLYFLLVGCIIGAMVGFAVAMIITIFVPAVITIRYFIDMHGCW